MRIVATIGSWNMNTLKNIREIWQKFQFILTPSQKRWGIVLAFMTLVGAVLETLGISVILPLVSAMINPESLWNNAYIQIITQRLNITENAQLIMLVGIGVILVYILKNLYLIFLSYIRVKYACKVQRELSVEMMRSYMGRGYAYFLKVNTGEVLRGMTTSIYNTFNALLQLLRIFAEILTVLCICIFIMATDFTMAISIMLLSVICLVAVMYGFRNWMKVCGEKGYHYAAVINKLILQAFEGIKEVLVMNRQKYFVDNYEKKYVKQQSAVIGQTVAAESPTYLIEGICVAGLMIVVCARIIFSGSPELMLPQLASFAVAAFRILPSLGRVSSYFNQFMYCVPSVNGTYENFCEVRKHKDSLLPSLEKEEKVEGFHDKIQVEHLTWKYEGNENIILDNVNLTIKKGQSVAFIGQSGAGKTTLADIILGLLKPQSGCVKVDDININRIPAQWSKMIGFVPQTVYLSDDSIRNNIAFGIEEEEIDDELIWNALEQAQLKSMVEEFPEKLDTVIGERGIRFSGGQRQRLAIARALYFNPDILVLDEATSALDTETEQAVMESIEALQGQKTLLIIAHRMTTIQKCDVIYEVGEGKVTIKEKKDIFNSEGKE